MRIRETEQIEFSNLLFDALFGLVLFFGIDSFLEINQPLYFIFYLFSIIIVIHWWLEFKAADDAFEKEVTNSALDLIVGIVEIVLIEYIVLMARSYNHIAATIFLISLLVVDIIWTVVWRYIGKWRTTEPGLIKSMEQELDNNLKADLITLVLLILFMLFVAPYISFAGFVVGFILIYLFFIIQTFRLKIIDIKFF